MPYSTRNKKGLFLPTTNVWNPEVSEVKDIKNRSVDEQVVDLYQNINLIVEVINKKDSAVFDTEEFLTGATWYNPVPTNPTLMRNEYRMVIDFGALGVATKSVAHGIDFGPNATTPLQVVDVWAVANKSTTPFSVLPIPYSSSVALNENIELSLDATNVTISNGIDRSAYDVCAVVIEYLLI